MLYRTRKTPLGPESRLVDALIADRTRHDAPQMIMKEPNLPTGYPDLVFVYARTDPQHLPCFRHAGLTVQHIKLVHHVYASGGGTIREIVQTSQIPERRLKLLLDDLVGARMLRMNGSQIRVRALSRIFFARKIVAVEAKIADWQRAIAQAILNTWFASESYVLLPPPISLSALATAEHHGIGIIVSDGSGVHYMTKPVSHRQPASYGSWLINEWAVQQLCKETK